MDDQVLTEIPMGLGMALAQNLRAMDYFTHLPTAQQEQIIDRTHAITSKSEMRQYVDSLGH